MNYLIFLYIILFSESVFSSLSKDNNFDNNLREACYSQMMLTTKKSFKLFDKVRPAQEAFRNSELQRMQMKPIARIIHADIVSKDFNRIWNEMVEDVNLAQGQLNAEQTKTYALKLGKEFEKKHKNFMKECSSIYTNIFTICAAQMGVELTETQKDCVQGEVPRLKKMLDPLVVNLLDKDSAFDKLDKELENKIKHSKDVKKVERILQEMEENGCHPDTIKPKFIYYVVKYHNQAFKKMFLDILKNPEVQNEVLNAFENKFVLFKEAGRKFDLTYFKEMLRLKFPPLNKADRRLLASQMKNANATKLFIKH